MSFYQTLANSCKQVETHFGKKFSPGCEQINKRQKLDTKMENENLHFRVGSITSHCLGNEPENIVPLNRQLDVWACYCQLPPFRSFHAKKNKWNKIYEITPRKRLLWESEKQTSKAWIFLDEILCMTILPVFSLFPWNLKFIFLGSHKKLSLV